MDLNELRSGVTVLTFAAFAWIVWHVWRRMAAQDVAEAARLPLADEAPTHGGAALPRGAQGAEHE
jgi:hypothetical protein